MYRLREVLSLNIKGNFQLISGSRKKIRLNSVRFKLVAGIFTLTVPLIVMLILQNYYAIDVVRNQVADSNKNMISLYMGQIDKNLEDVDNYLNNMVATGQLELLQLDSRLDQDYLMAKISQKNKLTSDLSMYKTIDSLFIYSVSRHDLIDTFRQGQSNYEQRESVRAFLNGMLKRNPNINGFETKSWFTQKINQEYYLFHIMKSGDQFIGAWVRVGNLMVPLKLVDIGGNGMALFATDNGDSMIHSNLLAQENLDLGQNLENYYFTGDNKQYLMVGEQSIKGNFSLIAIIPDQKILERLPFLQRINTSVSVGAFILLPICLLLLRKWLLVPLNNILSAMRAIRKGNISTRIHQYTTSEEFQIVNETFNQMMDQMHELRINVYEEQISKQKEKLLRMQLQMKPHFFINALNIIFNLAQSKNYKLIQEMVLCYVQYFRYMLRFNELSFVPLDEELNHIRNYLRLQELRVPSSLKCDIQIPDFLTKVNVPPLIIQSFIENTVKHAVTLDHIIHVQVQVDIDESGTVPSLNIVIRDTGKGFPPEILISLNSGDRLVNEQGEQIGIWNVKQRLYLQYGNNAQISFANNQPTGAIVKIQLPLEK